MYTKDLLLDAVVGRGLKSYAVAIEMQKKGLAVFTGNQHNPDWKWDKSKLKELPLYELEDLYTSLKD